MKEDVSFRRRRDADGTGVKYFQAVETQLCDEALGLRWCAVVQALLWAFLLCLSSDFGC